MKNRRGVVKLVGLVFLLPLLGILIASCGPSAVTNELASPTQVSPVPELDLGAHPSVATAPDTPQKGLPTSPSNAPEVQTAPGDQGAPTEGGSVAVSPNTTLTMTTPTITTPELSTSNEAGYEEVQFDDSIYYPQRMVVRIDPDTGQILLTIVRSAGVNEENPMGNANFKVTGKNGKHHVMIFGSTMDRSRPIETGDDGGIIVPLIGGGSIHVSLDAKVTEMTKDLAGGPNVLQDGRDTSISRVGHAALLVTDEDIKVLEETGRSSVAVGGRLSQIFVDEKYSRSDILIVNSIGLHINLSPKDARNARFELNTAERLVSHEDIISGKIDLSAHDLIGIEDLADALKPTDGPGALRQLDGSINGPWVTHFFIPRNGKPPLVIAVEDANIHDHTVGVEGETLPLNPIMWQALYERTP